MYATGQRYFTILFTFGSIGTIFKPSPSCGVLRAAPRRCGWRTTGDTLNADFDPLTSPPPAEVPLRDAPLVRVIAQVRFPLILSIERAEFTAPFQEAIRAAYPVLRQELAQGIVVGARGGAADRKLAAWRFADSKGEWRVSLAPWFLALETTAYTSRAEFLERFELAVRALHEHINPGMVQRLGLRYIDRVTGEALDDIRKLVRPEMLGVIGAAPGANARQALSEAIFDVPGDSEQLLARWGLLPPRSTVDPAGIEAIDEPSWLLDIDMFSAKQRDFEPATIVAEARRYAERLYTVFRWAVTPEFLRRYGGET